MLPTNLTGNIRPVSDLMHNTHEILDQLHQSGKPVILTENGRADSVLLVAGDYEKLLQTSQLAICLAQAEQDIAEGKTRSVRDFLAEFKRDKKISG